jgi:aminoglycoside N3'-acetyltransferase
MLNEKEFFNAFEEVISKKDDVIVIYSGISSFIFNIKFKSKNIPKTLLSILEKVTTKNRTLILPSFSSNSFMKEKIFDIKRSIDNIGLLPKEALKRNYYRTPQPLHSYLVYGKEKQLIKKLKNFSSWGKTSILNYMSKRNARICTFGLPWNRGCAYLHRFEELYLVPWRYFKIFKGPLYSNGTKVSSCSENKYSSPLNGILKYDFKPFISLIERSNSYKKSSNKYFQLESVKANCLDDIGNKIFSKDPWVIVKNKKNIKDWIKNKKEGEVFLSKINEEQKISSKYSFTKLI